jgi:hypothetical protein
LWTIDAPGTGSLANAGTLTPTYTPVAGFIGIVTLTMTVTPQGGGYCEVVNDKMNISISNVPTVNAGANAQICATGSYVLSGTSNTIAQWSSSGTGTFSPNNTTLNAVYTPSLADANDAQVILTLTTIQNGYCQNISDEMTLTIWKAVTAFAGNDATLCNGSSYHVLDANANNYSSVAWSHNGFGVLSNANTLSPTYSPGI